MRISHFLATSCVLTGLLTTGTAGAGVTAIAEFQSRGYRYAQP